MDLKQWKTGESPIAADAAKQQYWDLMKRIEGLVLAAEDMNHVCASLLDKVEEMDSRVTNLEKTIMNLLKCLKDAT